MLVDIVDSILVVEEGGEHDAAGGEHEQEPGPESPEPVQEQHTKDELIEIVQDEQMAEAKTVESKPEAETVDSKTDAETVESKSEAVTVDSKPEAESVKSKPKVGKTATTKARAPVAARPGVDLDKTKPAERRKVSVQLRVLLWG